MKLIILCLILLLSLPFSLSALEIPRSEEEFVTRAITALAISENLPPERLLAIASCESRLRQSTPPNGNNNGSNDVGVFRINSIHLPELKRLGLNRHDLYDNMKFATILIRRNGYRDWSASSKCWNSKEIALAGG